MHSIWEHFQIAGPIGLLCVPLALLTLLVGVISLLGGLVAKKSRPFTFVGAVALFLSALGLGLGALGMWWGRTRTEEALSGVSIDDFSQIEKIWVVGYDEARSAPMIALALMSFPLLVALAGSVGAWLRSRDASNRRPMVDAAVVGLLALVGIAAAGLAGVSSASAEDLARERARENLVNTTASVIAKKSCDPCPILASAIDHLGAEVLEQDVTGAKDRARQCIDDWLARIEKRKGASKRPCGPADGLSPDAADFVEEPSTKVDEPKAVDDESLSPREKALREAAEFGMLGLLDGGRSRPKDQRKDLEAVLASPLLIDGEQRAKVKERIAALDRPAPDSAEPGSSAPGSSGRSTRIRPGAASVAGRLPPEVIQRIVRQNYGRLRMCYEKALAKDPRLEGRITVRFVIGTGGQVAQVSTSGDLDDETVKSCVAKTFKRLQFPRPEGGLVTVSLSLGILSWRMMVGQGRLLGSHGRATGMLPRLS